MEFDEKKTPDLKNYEQIILYSTELWTDHTLLNYEQIILYWIMNRSYSTDQIILYWIMNRSYSTELWTDHTLLNYAENTQKYAIT